MIKRNQVKGIIGLMDITAHFGWDRKREYPTNRLDSFILTEEFAERLSNFEIREILKGDYNENRNKILFQETKEETIKQNLMSLKGTSNKTVLVKEKVEIKTGSKLEFLFRAKGLVSSVVKTLIPVVEFKTQPKYQANIIKWLESQDKWFEIKNNSTVLFKLDAISNVSQNRDNLVSRLLSGTEELFAELENQDKFYSDKEIESMRIDDIPNKAVKYFKRNDLKQKVMIGYFKDEKFIQAKHENKKVEFEMVIFMDFAYNLAQHNADKKSKNKVMEKFYFDYITTLITKCRNNKALINKMLTRKINHNKIQAFVKAGKMKIKH